jgi:hypothetical protein
MVSTEVMRRRGGSWCGGEGADERRARLENDKKEHGEKVRYGRIGEGELLCADP